MIMFWFLFLVLVFDTTLKHTHTLKIPLKEKRKEAVRMPSAGSFIDGSIDGYHFLVHIRISSWLSHISLCPSGF
jgi:hypothetical protein